MRCRSELTFVVGSEASLLVTGSEDQPAAAVVALHTSPRLPLGPPGLLPALTKPARAGLLLGAHALRGPLRGEGPQVAWPDFA